MRLYQQIRPSIASVAAVGTLAFVFASGMPLSASGQTSQTQQAAAAPAPVPARRAQEPLPPSPVANGQPLSMEEAVRMALENNLGIQAERLNPEIQNLALARANAAFAPALISSFSHGNSTAPPTDFLSSTAAVVTNGNLFTQAGIQQQLRWGGANYQVTFDGSRGTTDAPRQAFPLSLRSNMSLQFNQPLLRDFKIDSFRQQVLTARNNQSITDLQLQQRITQTARNARAAYYNLVGAISALEVAQESLRIARDQFRNNQTRVEVGTMAPIDITAAEAEVAANEEAVIVQEAAIKSAEDQLRTLIMNPSQPGFWTTVFKPTDTPNATLEARTIDVEAAVKNALANRTDIQQLKKQMANTDVSVKFAANQKLPAVDVTARYGVTGVGGTRNQFDPSGLTDDIIGTSIRGFGDVLRDVFGNDFRTWSVALNVQYPLGQSQADAAFAQAKLQQKQETTNLAELEMAVTTSVRLAARQVDTNLKRVEATRKAKELAQRRLDAENKRFTVGLSTTFELTQAQRDLSRAKSSELNALLDYNQSLVDFEAVQIAPIR